MADHPIDPRDHEPFGDRAFETPKKVTLSGKPPEPNAPPGAPAAIDPSTGMHKDYWVLSDEERAKGFVEPVRNSYQHVGIAGPVKGTLRDLTDEEKERYGDEGYVKFEVYGEGHESAAIGRFWKQPELDAVGKGCKSITSMGSKLAETYAASPEFYGSTFCATCSAHFPVGRDGEFVWKNTDQRVGTRMRARQAISRVVVVENAEQPRPVLKKAVCALATNLKGEILAVSRKDDPTKFGLPGGKVDEGEDLKDAIIREVKEETGLDFYPTMAVYTRPCLGETDYETTTFVGIIRGEVHSEEKGIVKYVTDEVLLAGPFGEYNKKLFEAVEDMFKRRKKT